MRRKNKKKKEMQQASKASKGSEALALSGGGSSSSTSSWDAGAAGSSGDGGGKNEGDGLNDVLLDLGSHRTGRSSSLASLSSLTSSIARSTDSAELRTRRRFTSGGAQRAPPHVLNTGRNRRPGGLLLGSGEERRRRLLATPGVLGRKRNGEGRKGEGGVFSAKLDAALLDEGAQAGVDEWAHAGGLSSGRHQAVLIGEAASFSRAYSRTGAAVERAAETMAETAVSGAKLKKGGITNTKMTQAKYGNGNVKPPMKGDDVGGGSPAVDPLLKQWLGGGTRGTAPSSSSSSSSPSSPSNTEVANKNDQSLYGTAKAPPPGTPYGVRGGQYRHTAAEQSSATRYTLANQGSEAEDPRASLSSSAHKSGWFSKSGKLWQNSTPGKMQEARWAPIDVSATRGPGSEISATHNKPTAPGGPRDGDGESLEQRLRRNVFDKAPSSATSDSTSSAHAGSGARTNSEGGWQGGKKGGWVSQFATPNKARKEEKAGWSKGAREAKAGTSKQAKQANDPSLKCPEWQNPGEWKDGQCVCDPCVLNDGTDYPQLTGWGDVTAKGETRD